MRNLLWRFALILVALFSVHAGHAQTLTLYNSYQDCLLQADIIGEADFAQAEGFVNCTTNKHTISMIAEVCANECFTATTGQPSEDPTNFWWLGPSGTTGIAGGIETVQAMSYQLGQCSSATASFWFTIDNQTFNLSNIKATGNVPGAPVGGSDPCGVNPNLFGWDKNPPPPPPPPKSSAQAAQAIKKN